MAKTLFRKNWKKEIVPALVGSGIRGGSTVATAWLTNDTVPKVLKIGETNPDNLRKYNKSIGAALFLLGTFGEAAIADDKARKVAEGISSYGALHMAGNFLAPSQKASFGLSGAGAGNSEVTDWEMLRSQMGAVDPLSDINKTLDDAMAKAITGPGYMDDPERGNFGPYDPANPTAASAGAGGGASVKSNSPANVNGITDEFDNVQ